MCAAEFGDLNDETFVVTQIWLLYNQVLEDFMELATSVHRQVVDSRHTVAILHVQVDVALDERFNDVEQVFTLIEAAEQVQSSAAIFIFDVDVDVLFQEDADGFQQVIRVIVAAQKVESGRSFGDGNGSAHSPAESVVNVCSFHRRNDEASFEGFQVEIGFVLDQEFQRVHHHGALIVTTGEVQGGPAELVFGVDRIQHPASVGTQQQSEDVDGSLAVVVPAQHVHGSQSVFGFVVDVDTWIAPEQQFDDLVQLIALIVATESMQHRLIVSVFTQNVGLAVDQHLEDGQQVVAVIVTSQKVQRCQFFLVNGVDVDLFVEQQVDDVDALRTLIVTTDDVQGRPPVDRDEVDVSAVRDQHSDDFVGAGTAILPADVHQRRHFVFVGGVDVDVLAEQVHEVLDVILARIWLLAQFQHVVFQLIDVNSKFESSDNFF